jgi:hypothetical protein
MDRFLAQQPHELNCYDAPILLFSCRTSLHVHDTYSRSTFLAMSVHPVPAHMPYRDHTGSMRHVQRGCYTYRMGISDYGGGMGAVTNLYVRASHYTVLVCRHGEPNEI